MKEHCNIDKGLAQHIHFSRRLKERYGMDSTKDFETYLLDVIQHDSPHPTIKQTNRICLHKIYAEIDNNIESLLIVYDKKRKTLVSVLPKTDLRHRSV